MKEDKSLDIEMAICEASTPSAISRREFLRDAGALGATALGGRHLAALSISDAGVSGAAFGVTSTEYAAGEVVLPFSYTIRTSSEAQPEGLNFKGQAGPDNCQVFVRIENEIWEFRSQWIIGLGTVARYKGPDVDHMVRVEDGTYPDGMTACWFLGGMWYHAQERKLYAPMHVEQDGERRLYTNLRKIALGTSVDQGRTWKYEGDIITSETYYYPHEYFKFSGSAYGNGVADFGFYADEREGYFYVFPDEGWSLKTARQGEMCWNTRVARCAIADKMASGRWRYFYQGTWDEPALGGKSSSISPGHVWGIVYSSAIDRYVCVFPANEDPPGDKTIDGVCIGCCSSLTKQDWVWGYCPEATFGFLNLLNDEGTDVARTCRDSFRYYAYFNEHDYRRMDVTLAQGERRTLNIERRYLFQPHPESSDAVLGRRTKGVAAGEPAVTYSGPWETMQHPDSFDGTIRVSGKAGAAIEMTFTGPEIYWRAGRAPNSGIADVFIDGRLRRTVDCFTPRSTGYKQFAYIHRDLGPGKHTIRIVVRGKKHADATDSLIHHVGFEYQAESYRASAGFSSIMGKNGWHYYQVAGADFHELQPIGDEASGLMHWSGNAHVQVGIDYQSNGTARRWRVPRDGKVKIEGRAEPKAGAAIAPAIWTGTQRLWAGEAGGSQAAHDLEVTVRAGDWITFLADSPAGSESSGHANASLRWDPVVTYTDNVVSPAVWIPNSPGSENLALNKYARSKFLVSTYRPFDGADGSLTHPFLVHADDPISHGDDWFSVDLDRPCLVDRCVISFQSQNPRYVPRRFTLQRSDDGLVWGDVETISKVTGKATTVLCIPLLRVERQLQPFRARFVRMYLPDGKPFAINGFELYRSTDRT